MEFNAHEQVQWCVTVMEANEPVVKALVAHQDMEKNLDALVAAVVKAHPETERFFARQCFAGRTDNPAPARPEPAKVQG